MCVRMCVLINVWRRNMREARDSLADDGFLSAKPANVANNIQSGKYVLDFARSYTDLRTFTWIFYVCGWSKTTTCSQFVRSTIVDCAERVYTFAWHAVWYARVTRRMIAWLRESGEAFLHLHSATRAIEGVLRAGKTRRFCRFCRANRRAKNCSKRATRLCT